MQSWVSYKSFHLYDVEFGLCYCWEFFHPSWWEVTMVRIDVVVWACIGLVETVGFRQVMWFVMLKFAKDRVLGVDTLGQQVPPRVQYGMTCLLIRAVVGCESCSAVWGKMQDVIWSTRSNRGSSHEETLALLGGTRGQGKSAAKHD
jgi:hypothetical protein